jgi:hypothetical protein
LISFTRKRLLPFQSIVSFILQKTGSSLQICLDDFFEDTLITPGKSAFSQARGFLCFKVFKRLNLLVTSIFYANARYKKWKSFRVLSVDGSTIKLPNHRSLKTKFTQHKFGPKANVPHWMSRISYLYDVFNGLVIDAQMESFKTSEAQLCKNHLGFIKKGDLLLFDRYYASYELMALLLSKGCEFVFRMRSHSWKCVDTFIQSSEKETLVELILPKKCNYLQQTHKNIGKKITVRLVKKVNRKGEVKVFATSLLDSNNYSRSSILNLYKQRWQIEEAYKLIKARLEVANFSGKSVESVQQDFYAKTFMLSFSASLKNGIYPHKKTKNKDKRKPVINATYAISKAKKLIKHLFKEGQIILDLLQLYMQKVETKIEYSRVGQWNKRKPDKGTVARHNMNYKVI